MSQLPPSQPRLVAYPQPVRVEAVPGSAYGLAILPPPRALSGVAIGALAAGVGSILVSAAVWCFGLLGARAGWGALVAGAFCVLAGLLAFAGLVLGIIALRQIRRAGAVELYGKGYAIAGLSCGAAGLLLTLVGLAVALALAAAS